MTTRAPIITEPDDAQDLLLLDFIEYLTCFDDYCNLDEVGKLDPALNSIKRELNKTEILLANVDDARITSDDEASREDYARLRRMFCEQVRRIAQYHKATNSLSTQAAEILQRNGWIHQSSVPQTASLLSGVCMAIGQYVQTLKHHENHQ
jgi:hypothetical protein